MDAPPIQYAKTSDGVSIAFWTVGEGPPLGTTSGTTPAPVPAAAGAVLAASLPPTGAGQSGDATQIQLWAIVPGAFVLSLTCAYVARAIRWFEPGRRPPGRITRVALTAISRKA